MTHLVRGKTMAEKTITLAEALSMKKSIECRIRRRLEALNKICIGLSASSNEKQSVIDKRVKDIRSVYRSISTMSTNYSTLSSAIAAANAKTKTGICAKDGHDMTISELLAANSNGYMDTMVESLSSAMASLAGSSSTVDQFNTELDRLAYINDEQKQKMNIAIQAANAKKKIKVTFID